MNNDKAKCWERLKYVPQPSPQTFDFDVSAMYAAQALNVFQVNRVEWKEGDNVTIRILKSR